MQCSPYSDSTEGKTHLCHGRSRRTPHLMRYFEASRTIVAAAWCCSRPAKLSRPPLNDPADDVDLGAVRMGTHTQQGSAAACDSTAWGSLTEAGKPGELAGRHWKTPHAPCMPHQRCRQLSQAQMVHATEAEGNLGRERQSRRGPRHGEMEEMGQLIGALTT